MVHVFIKVLAYDDILDLSTTCRQATATFHVWLCFTGEVQFMGHS